MSEAIQELTATLRSQGVIPMDAPAPPGESADRPWYVALLQGVAGWLAGIFLLVFLGLIFRPETGVTLFTLGVLLLAAAWFMYRMDRNAVFLDQLALAMSMAGQIAVAVSVLEDQFSGLSIAATALAVQLVVLFVMPNKTARMLAALFAAIAWVFTVRFLFRPGSGEELLFGAAFSNEPHRLALWTIPTSWLLTWLPLLAIAAWLIHREAQWMASKWRGLARPALTGVLLGLSLGGIDVTPINPFVLADQPTGFPLTWWALFPMLNVALAMTSAYGAFRLRSRGLLGSAVLGALLHLSHFYYFYGTTLLWKSVIMLCVGAALLLAGVALSKRTAGATA
jgi:hypothetical protein